MTSDELKTARESLGYGVADLACALRTPVSTVRDWEAGRTRIPGAAAVAVELLLERDQGVMTVIRERIAASVARQFPQGIRSLPAGEEWV